MLEIVISMVQLITIV